MRLPLKDPDRYRLCIKETTLLGRSIATECFQRFPSNLIVTYTSGRTAHKPKGGQNLFVYGAVVMPYWSRNVNILSKVCLVARTRHAFRPMFIDYFDGNPASIYKYHNVPSLHVIRDLRPGDTAESLEREYGVKFI
jgi:hypothetical protein